MNQGVLSSAITALDFETTFICCGRTICHASTAPENSLGTRPSGLAFYSQLQDEWSVWP